MGHPDCPFEMLAGEKYVLLASTFPITRVGQSEETYKFSLDVYDKSLAQINDGFVEGKDLVVFGMSVIGEEQINALKDIGVSYMYENGFKCHKNARSS
ncbi:unnamed protein product [Lupinus luteus]|uniref:Uncharacterized protein n=1 Tax=Lupinus luteus TaxID=3873 RepID=A0AAV1WH53_LUPLU